MQIIYYNGLFWFISSKLESLPWSFWPALRLSPYKTSHDKWARHFEKTCLPARDQCPYIASSPVTHFKREKGCNSLSSKGQTWYFVRWMFYLPILPLKVFQIVQLDPINVRSVCKLAASLSDGICGFLYNQGCKRKINTTCSWIISEKSIYKWLKVKWIIDFLSGSIKYSQLRLAVSSFAWQVGSWELCTQFYSLAAYSYALSFDVGKG